MNFRKDDLYKKRLGQVVDFAFDDKVVAVFPDMIHRSIPGYASLLTLLQAVFRARFANQSGLHIYDLGCSLGAVTLALAQVMPVDTRFTGVDLSPDMIKKYDEAIRVAELESRTAVIEGDINNIPLQVADAICLNFVLQFLEPHCRRSIIERCYQALNEGGVLMVAEKTQADENTTAWHEQFKKNNGYSDLEISQKRSAIENIMRIDSTESIVKRLQETGFTTVLPIFQCFSFRAWVAIK